MPQFVNGDIRAVHLAFDTQQIVCYSARSAAKLFILNQDATSSVMLMPIPIRASDDIIAVPDWRGFSEAFMVSSDGSADHPARCLDSDWANCGQTAPVA
jgi:hypothetical protein